MADPTQSDIDAAQQANHSSADTQHTYSMQLLTELGTTTGLLTVSVTAGQAKDKQITTLTQQVATLEAQNVALQAELDALKPKYNVTVNPGPGTPLQTGLNAVPVNGTIFINDGTYTENPTVPHACQIFTGSTNGVIVDLGGKPFTFSPPSGTVTKGGLTVQNAVFGKSGQPAVLITDNTSIDVLTVTKCDSVGVIVRGTGKSDGTGGNGIKFGTLVTDNCGEMGLGGSHTRGCQIGSWTFSNCCNPDSFNPNKWPVVPGKQGGAGKFSINDGMTFGKVTGINTSYNGPWFDTQNVNCVVNNPNIPTCGLASAPGSYNGIMIEQNDGTAPDLGTKGVNGATVTVNGGVIQNAGNTDVMIAESSGVAVNNLEYHKQVGFRQMSGRPSKIHDVSILGCNSYGSTYPASGYTNSAADIAAQKIVIDKTTYHGMPRNIGYWFGTQTTLAQMQALGFEKNGTVAT